MGTKLIILSMILVLSIFSVKHHKVIKWWLDESLNVHYLDIGQGDAAVIKLPNRKIIVIDGGPDESLMYRISEVLPFWVDEVNLVIISHFHEDHISGLLYLLETYKVNCVLYAEPAYQDVETSFTVSKLTNLISEKNITVIKPNQFDKISGCVAGPIDINNYYFSSRCVNLKNSKLCTTLDQNNLTMVTYIKYEETALLFLGDLEKEFQTILLGPYSDALKNTQIIKVPHQGSIDSLNTGFIKMISPKYAVISIGDNSYGHPSKKVVDTYEENGVKVLRTDIHGNISFTCNKSKCLIEE
jgi:competence protein ComEC